MLKIRENELKYQRLNYIIEVRTIYPLPSSFIDLPFNIFPVDTFQQHLVCPMSHHVPLPLRAIVIVVWNALAECISRGIYGWFVFFC